MLAVAHTQVCALGLRRVSARSTGSRGHRRRQPLDRHALGGRGHRALEIRPELINAAGLLSGAVTYALVDYCMGSTLWRETTESEGIATVSIAINYVATATEGEIVCRTTLDRRNRRLATLRSEVTTADGRLLCTAIGSYTIFPRKDV